MTTNVPNLTSSDLELVHDGSLEQEIGVRILNVTIPKGANITKAELRFTIDETTGGNATVDIYGQDDDDGARFTTGGSNVSGRTKTTASASFWKLRSFIFLFLNLFAINLL